MTKKTIFSVNTVVPGSALQEIGYSSEHTLLDADIILFTPTILFQWYGGGDFRGKTCLSQSGSFWAAEKTRHWRTEIVEAANAGKLVIVYLVKPVECFRYTGDKETSGTGRNQKVTNFVDKISSYDALPVIVKWPPKTGQPESWIKL